MDRGVDTGGRHRGGDTGGGYKPQVGEWIQGADTGAGTQVAGTSHRWIGEWIGGRHRGRDTGGGYKPQMDRGVDTGGRQRGRDTGGGYYKPQMVGGVDTGALQRKFRLYILFLGIARPQPQFPHSCVFGRFIYSQDQSTYFLQQNRQNHSGNI
jgi:hypothetical protein